MTRLKIAKHRQEVRALKARRGVLEHIAMQHNEMMAAYLLERRLRPKAPAAHYLSVPTPQGSRHLYVRKAVVEAVRRQTDAWREFSQAMAEWVRINKKIEAALRQIGSGRCRKIELKARKVR
ncbi:MAG: hypothetical protein HY611_05850 [Elusimicrobia bacterium]|nr:hypothetical protein [Elusimicrobiota bacterium]